MDDRSFDVLSEDGVHSPLVAVPGPHISGQRAIATEAAVRPRIDDLLAQAHAIGVNVDREQRDLLRVLERMKTKVGVPPTRPLRLT